MSSKTKNITDCFAQAKGKIVQGYSMNDFLIMLKVFQASNQYFLDWDNGEEFWGSMIDSNSRKKVLLFNTIFPLIFIDSTIARRFSDFISSDVQLSPTIILVKDWDEKVFSIDATAFDSNFVWHSTIGCLRVSANDIWYSTV